MIQLRTGQPITAQETTMIQLRTGQTITDEIIKQCADWPEAAKAELWKGHTLNRREMAIITKALDNQAAAQKAKKAKKETE